MPNTLRVSQSNVIVGLGTFTHTTLSSTMYNVTVRATEVPTSSLSITIAQSGSASATITSTAPTSAQGHVELQKLFNCASGDVLTITLSSSAPIDNQLNTVKSVVTINVGMS